MFESLSTKLNAVFDRLRGRGALTEADVMEAMREVRLALLEADVALPVVKDFIAKVRERAVGAEVLRLGHAGPAGRQDRPRRAGRDAGRRRRGAARPQCARAGRRS